MKFFILIVTLLTNTAIADEFIIEQSYYDGLGTLMRREQLIKKTASGKTQVADRIFVDSNNELREEWCIYKGKKANIREDGSVYYDGKELNSSDKKTDEIINKCSKNWDSAQVTQACKSIKVSGVACYEGADDNGNKGFVRYFTGDGEKTSVLFFSQNDPGSCSAFQKKSAEPLQCADVCESDTVITSIKWAPCRIYNKLVRKKKDDQPSSKPANKSNAQLKREIKAIVDSNNKKSKKNK